jgi:acetyl esterase/lipase
VTTDEETHNYIFLRYGDIRFDQLLLSMVDEVAAAINVATDRFWMAGFSGGAQFANRFAYLHASRLAGVSISAPGMITSLDAQAAWFTGVRDVEELFGAAVDWPGLRRLRVHVTVGGDDIRPEVLIPPSSPLFCPGINDSGSNRVERAMSLHRLLIDAGVAATFDLVPGADHVPSDLQSSIAAFFRAEFQRTTSAR